MSRQTFGPFVLDSGRLLRDGDVVSVGQRGLAVLDALLESEGAVVAKGDLLERAWPGTIVEEGNLTVQIAALRKALGQDADGRDWIVTVPRVGYRLAGATARAPGPVANLPEKPALAVLPFMNLGGDAEQDWFADGVVEDIITALSRFRSFAVVARNSSFAYGRPPSGGPVAMLVHDGSWRHGWCGRRSWSGLRSRPQNGFWRGRFVAQR